MRPQLLWWFVWLKDTAENMAHDGWSVGGISDDEDDDKENDNDTASNRQH